MVDLQLGVPGGDARFGGAASSGQPPVAGAFAGLGAAGRDGGLAEDRAQVPVALLGLGASLAGAGLVVLGAGLLGAAEVQAFVGAWRAAGTPVSIMLTAP